ncbi:GatB/YqeY domain-containing protein [Cerasibacillus terrae]|uniref:GatB/YqeY domain-containing protein n=1 Tax=Cerasibacillus terrae TaxID=2498845 RepID=A0A5C8P3Y1_9BACI|nr:GatB/YqeY domain-containing protein [Cerasibacillus terrae]TXL68014.1 GatB/YqeY domain-containing protein [Cerasibacillus terrae]
MSILAKLNDDMKQAMKAKDKERLSVIRMVKSSLQNEMIKLGNNELSADEELTILSRESKQRKDSLQEFKTAKREDLVKKIETELNILQEYMPKQLTEAELELLVEQTIQEVHASSKKDMGKVMAALIPKTKGKADGALVSKIVQQKLT